MACKKIIKTLCEARYGCLLSLSRIALLPCLRVHFLRKAVESRAQLRTIKFKDPIFNLQNLSSYVIAQGDR